MCLGEMRNLAPACLNGLSTAYLSGGISAVSAQWVEHEHKYSVWMRLWTQYLLLCCTCAPRISLKQLLMQEKAPSEPKLHF